MNKEIIIRIRQERGYFCVQVKAKGDEFRNTNIIHRANFKKVTFETFEDEHLWKGERKFKRVKGTKCGSKNQRG